MRLVESFKQENLKKHFKNALTLVSIDGFFKIELGYYEKVQ